jgi:4-amino-4-deoxy-L-arabinose transferase-like glycosyltransferase
MGKSIEFSFQALKARLYDTLRRPVSMIGLGILAGLMALRAFNLLLLPMFHDEAIHIARAQSILAEHTLLINTNGGKFLQPWLLALVLPLADNPLLAARALSAAIGLLAGIGCYLLARQLYQRDDVALVAAALYALDPFSLFQDRMALPDSLLNALAIWSLLFSLSVVRQGRWRQILALGLCLGAAIATKLSGIIFATFPLLAAWLWRSDLPRRRVWLAVLAAWLLSLPWLLPVGLDIAHQYQSTVFHSWVGKGITGSAYLALLSQNLGLIADTLWTYLTPPLLLLALAEAGLGLRQRDRSSGLLVLAALVTPVFFLFLTVSETFYPRYLLPAFPLLLILAARGLVALADWLWKHRPWPAGRYGWGLLAGLFLLANSLALRLDYLLLTDPPRAAWVPLDYGQYIVGWSAGYGVIDAAAYLRQQADGLGTIVVLYADNASWPYNLNRPGIHLGLVDFGQTVQPSFVRKLRESGATVFAVLDRPHDDEHVVALTNGRYATSSTLVATFPRPGGESRIEVYRIKFTP